MTYRYTPGYSEPAQPERYRYVILTVWWPYEFAENPLDNYARQGYRIIDVHWTGEKNDKPGMQQEKIVYHLEWTPEPKVPTYTVKPS